MTVPSSLASARHKFEGTQPYCADPHYWIPDAQQFQEVYPSLPPGALVGVYHPTLPRKMAVEGGRLVEVVGYDDGSFHLILIKKTSDSIDLEFPHENREDLSPEPKITLGFICTDDEPYISILRKTLEFYRSWIVPERFEVAVVMFGTATLPDWVRVVNHPLGKFDMAYARNCCLKNASHDLMFILDADVQLSKENVENILLKFKTIPHHGVFNLKNDPKIGNGLWFGRRDVMVQNGFDERFKRFWYEDTEFLMNFSRTGVVPVVVFEPFCRVDHTRSKTLAGDNMKGNFNLFSNILNSGKRLYSP